MQHRNPDETWAALMAALGPIHDRVRSTARRLARSPAEGDDLFQEAVLRAFDKYSSLRDPARFPGWFYAVLLSVHRSRSRRSFWRRFLPLEGLAAESRSARGALPGRGSGPRIEASEPAADPEWVRSERVSRALARLPAVQREAVVLFEIEGFSCEEIAAMQKVSLSAVKSRLQRGRGRLRRFYERLGYSAAGSGLSGKERNHEVRGSQPPPGRFAGLRGGDAEGRFPRVACDHAARPAVDGTDRPAPA